MVYIANSQFICTNGLTLTPMPQNDKSTRFKRLASRRTAEVLDKLRILGNCADKRTYAYTDEEIDKIFRTIDEQVKIVKSQFKKPKKGFKL